MRKIFVPILAIILCAGLLLGLYNMTLPLRQAKAEEELQQKLLTLLPGSETFTTEAYDGEDQTIRAVYKAENGYVIATSTQGYTGPIAMLIGVSNEEQRHRSADPGYGRDLRSGF